MDNLVKTNITFTKPTIYTTHNNGDIIFSVSSNDGLFSDYITRDFQYSYGWWPVKNEYTFDKSTNFLASEYKKYFNS